MDRGARQVTDHGNAEELDPTQRLNYLLLLSVPDFESRFLKNITPVLIGLDLYVTSTLSWILHCIIAN